MDLTYETRSRSRSKTPGFENGNSAKAVKKTPNVSLIEEEIIEIIDLEPASQTPAQRPKRKGKATKIVTSDYSSDNYSPESVKQSLSQQMSQQMSSKSAVSSSSKTTVTTTTMVSSSSKKTTNGSGESSKKVEQATSTTSASEEIMDSKINESHSVFANVFNAIKTSTPILAAKRSQRITSEVSSTVSADHPAYKEYKEAGEYWNKYPKTDYTYSELSPHRRDLGKGNVAMPNMSRKSLEKYQNRVESMIYNNPQQESFLRRRFFSNNTSINKHSAQLQYDSQDEVDETLVTRKSKRTTTEISENNFLSKFFLYIINLFYSCYYSVKSVFYTNVREQNSYGSPRASLLKNQQVGIFARGYGVVKTSVLTAISKMYLFISTVLCFDTWLLRARSENVQENKNRKRFLLMLLVLFPLLMLGAMLLSDETNSTKIFTNTNFPPITHYFAQITHKLTDFNWIFVPFTTLATTIKSFSLTTPQPKEQLKMALDDDKLGMLMKHIDQYIDSAIGQKFQDNNQVVVKTVSDQLVVNFANTIKESLSTHKSSINKDDIVVIADKIKSQLKLELNVMNNEEQQSLLLNNVLLKNEKFLTEIEKVVKQNIKFHHNEFILNNQNVDLSDILSTILASKDLHILIDDRMKIMINRLDQHDIEIEGIKGDLLLLKANVAQRFTSVDNDVTELRGQQKSFVEDFYRFKLENDGKLEQLLLEIDGKLVKLGESKFTAVDASVRKNLLSILGFDLKTSANGEMDEKDIKSWISSMFVAKSHLEDRLKQVEMNSNVAMENEVNKNAGFFMNEINERIKNEITLAIVAKSSEMEAKLSTKVSVNGGLSEEDVRKIVQNVLAIYDADKTGQVDFALETAGGQVVSTRCTENYQKRNAEISIFGIPLWYPSNTPRTVISPSVHPGECWAFQGFPGFLVIQLNNMIHVTGFTLEHIPQSLAPNGIIDSAPYNFSVHGLLSEMDHEPVLFGNYHYLAEKNAPSLQYFPIKNTNIDRPYQVVELRIESNHGNPQYTCLYRFRVHGNTVKNSKR